MDVCTLLDLLKVTAPGIWWMTMHLDAMVTALAGCAALLLCFLNTENGKQWLHFIGHRVSSSLQLKWAAPVALVLSCHVAYVAYEGSSMSAALLLEVLLVSTLTYVIGQHKSKMTIRAVANEAAVRLVALHRENEGLADEKEELETELQALAQQRHPALHAGSPADLILEMLDLMLKGGVPCAEDLLLLREYILSGVHHHDMYQPLDLWQQLHMMTMEPDVEEALCYQLLGTTPAQKTTPDQPSLFGAGSGSSAGGAAHGPAEGDTAPGASLQPRLSDHQPHQDRLATEQEAAAHAEEGLRNMLSAIACDQSVLDAQRYPSGLTGSNTSLQQLLRGCTTQQEHMQGGPVKQASLRSSTGMFHLGSAGSDASSVSMQPCSYTSPPGGGSMHNPSTGNIHATQVLNFASVAAAEAAAAGQLASMRAGEDGQGCAAAGSVPASPIPMEQQRRHRLRALSTMVPCGTGGPHRNPRARSFSCLAATVHHQQQQQQQQQALQAAETARHPAVAVPAAPDHAGTGQQQQQVTLLGSRPPPRASASTSFLPPPNVGDKPAQERTCRSSMLSPRSTLPALSLPPLQAAAAASLPLCALSPTAAAPEPRRPYHGFMLGSKPASDRTSHSDIALPTFPHNMGAGGAASERGGSVPFLMGYPQPRLYTPGSGGTSRRASALSVTQPSSGMSESKGLLTRESVCKDLMLAAQSTERCCRLDDTEAAAAEQLCVHASLQSGDLSGRIEPLEDGPAPLHASSVPPALLLRDAHDTSPDAIELRSSPSSSAHSSPPVSASAFVSASENSMHPPLPAQQPLQPPQPPQQEPDTLPTSQSNLMPSLLDLVQQRKQAPQEELEEEQRVRPAARSKRPDPVGWLSGPGLSSAPSAPTTEEASQVPEKTGRLSQLVPTPALTFDTALPSIKQERSASVSGPARGAEAQGLASSLVRHRSLLTGEEIAHASRSDSPRGSLASSARHWMQGLLEGGSTRRKPSKSKTFNGMLKPREPAFAEGQPTTTTRPPKVKRGPLHSLLGGIAGSKRSGGSGGSSDRSRHGLQPSSLPSLTPSGHSSSAPAVPANKCGSAQRTPACIAQDDDVPGHPPSLSRTGSPFVAIQLPFEADRVQLQQHSGAQNAAKFAPPAAVEAPAPHRGSDQGLAPQQQQPQQPQEQLAVPNKALGLGSQGSGGQAGGSIAGPPVAAAGLEADGAAEAQEQTGSVQPSLEGEATDSPPSHPLHPCSALGGAAQQQLQQQPQQAGQREKKPATQGSSAKLPKLAKLGSVNMRPTGSVRARASSALSFEDTQQSASITDTSCPSPQTSLHSAPNLLSSVGGGEQWASTEHVAGSSLPKVLESAHAWANQAGSFPACADGDAGPGQAAACMPGTPPAAMPGRGADGSTPSCKTLVAAAAAVADRRGGEGIEAGGNTGGEEVHPGGKEAERPRLLLRTPSLRPPPVAEMERVLARAFDSFSFDAFELAAVTQGHPLSTLGYYLFHKTNLISSFGMHPVKLARFLRTIEAGYTMQNPYHNPVHAADVLQTLHVIMYRGGMLPHFTDRMSQLAALLAAIVHDYEHMGLTNDFLVNSSSMLAIRYNDRAPLENHHLAAAFTVLHTPDHNFLSNLPKADYSRLRKIMIELVLATDMKQHFALVGQFNAVVRRVKPGSKHSEGSPVSGSGHSRHTPLSLKPKVSMGRALTTNLSMVLNQPASPRADPRVTNSGSLLATNPTQRMSMDVTESALMQLRSAMHEASARQEHAAARANWRGAPLSLTSPPSDHSTVGDRMTAGDRSSHGERTTGGDRSTNGHNSCGEHGTTRGSDASCRKGESVSLDDAQKLLLLQIAVKCADLGHVAEDHDVHVRWVRCLEEEFYRQGDREKAAQLPVSPLFDRAKPGVTKSQVGFFDVVVLPLFQALKSIVPGVQPLLDGVDANYKYWKDGITGGHAE